MKTPFKMNSLVLLIFTLAAIPSYAQHETGNGGGEEVEFVAIADEVQTWLADSLKDGTLAEKLKLDEVRIDGKEITAQEVYDKYAQARKDVGVRLKFSKNHISFNENDRICSNHDEPEKHIQCSIPEWRAISNVIRYTIVFHEYLGIARLEKNEGDYSTYPISKNLVAYVFETVKYQLGNKRVRRLLQPTDPSCTVAINTDSLYEFATQLTFDEQKAILNEFGLELKKPGEQARFQLIGNTNCRTDWVLEGPIGGPSMRDRLRGRLEQYRTVYKRTEWTNCPLFLMEGSKYIVAKYPKNYKAPKKTYWGDNTVRDGLEKLAAEHFFRSGLRRYHCKMGN